MKKIFGNRLASHLIAILGTIIFCAILNFFWIVPINIHFAPFWLLMIVTALFGYGISTICETVYKEINNIKDDSPRVYGVFNILKQKLKQKKMSVYFVILASVITIMVIVTSVAGSVMFNGKKYAQIIQVEDGNFEKDIINASSDDIITVDVKTAQKLGDRTLGSLENSFWYDVNDEYNLVSISGKEYRISPIEYGDIFKCFRAKSIPGYILVNAKTQDDSKVVEVEQGIKYSPSAAFKYDLRRHLHYQYPTYIFSKSFFEVDDNGNTFWITPIRTATICLMNGFVETRAIITNAVTGESTEYQIADIPNWVDHVHSVDYLMDRIGWHYQYSGGFINSFTSKTNVYKTAYSYKNVKEADDESKYTPFEGYNSIMSKDSGVLFYTGITPANSAETNIGFVLANPRTGEVKFYEANGAEESSAQIAAEGLVQNLRYSASFPTIINVDGVETYFMTLKDGAGLVKKYALCNVEQYSKCVEADSISEAIAKYKIKLGFEVSDTIKEDKNDIPENIEIVEKEGAISNVKEAEIDGYTYYYFTLLNDNEKITYMSSIENGNMQPLNMTSGTNVKIKYYISQKEKDIGIVREIKFQ